MTFKYSLKNGSVKQKIVGRSFEMVANAGGGYAFKLEISGFSPDITSVISDLLDRNAIINGVNRPRFLFSEEI